MSTPKFMNTSYNVTIRRIQQINALSKIKLETLMYPTQPSPTFSAKLEVRPLNWEQKSWAELSRWNSCSKLRKVLNETHPKLQGANTPRNKLQKTPYLRQRPSILKRNFKIKIRNMPTIWETDSEILEWQSKCGRPNPWGSDMRSKLCKNHIHPVSKADMGKGLF